MCVRVCVGCVLGWHCRPGLTVAFLMPAIIKFVQQRQSQVAGHSIISRIRLCPCVPTVCTVGILNSLHSYEYTMPMPFSATSSMLTTVNTTQIHKRVLVVAKLSETIHCIFMSTHEC